MAPFFLFTNRAILFLIACSPVFITLALAASLWKTPAFFHRRALHSALFSTGLGLADLALFAALPRLNLSFGPLSIPLSFWWGMRYLFFIGWVTASRWLLSKQTNLSPSTTAFIIFNLVLTALLLYGFYFEPFNLGVTTLEHTVDEPGIEPIRIVHVTDIHLERSTFREQNLISLVADQHPDIILLTGDYLNLSNLNDPVALEQARHVLAQFNAPLGVYAVNGTVDGPYHMQALFEGLEINVLDNEIFELSLGSGNVYLLGVSNRNAVDDAANLVAMTKKLPPNAFAILLYHTPDLIEIAVQEGIDLYLSGHTHGGQVRLPFYGALITLSRYGKRFEMGSYQVGDTYLYVSRGIGMEGSFAPRLRFLCPPEIVTIDLKNSQ